MHDPDVVGMHCLMHVPRLHGAHVLDSMHWAYGVSWAGDECKAGQADRAVAVCLCRIRRFANLCHGKFRVTIHVVSVQCCNMLNASTVIGMWS